MTVPTPRAGKWLEVVLREAVDAGARSVHLQPDAHGRLVVRLRGPSGLVPAPTPVVAADLAGDLVDALKERAGLAREERRVPQEGTLALLARTPDEQPLHARVATLRTIHGEAAVVEVLDPQRPLGLGELGLDPSDRLRLLAALDAPGGLVLATGPRGQGTRTLLHACLRHLVTDTTRAVYSVPHDRPPDLPGVVSIAVDPDIGAPHASWLRFVLRTSDADAVHVSTIRDLETSNLVLDAAARGLLVLASTHADDGAGAVTRLLELGNEPYLVSAGLSVVVACRVVRRLCDGCKLPAPAPDPDDQRRLAPRLVAEELLPEWGDSFVPRRHGCDACRGTGHVGDVGLYEVLDRVGATLDAVSRSAARFTSEDLRAHAYERARSLRETALLHAAAGRISLIDALRSTPAAPGGEPPRAAL